MTDRAESEFLATDDYGRMRIAAYGTAFTDYEDTMSDEEREELYCLCRKWVRESFDENGRRKPGS